MKDAHKYVSKVAKSFKARLPLTNEAQAALGQLVSSRVRMAQRLLRLPDRLAEINKVERESGKKLLDKTTVKALLKKHDFPTTMVTNKGELDFNTEEDARNFLDLIDGLVWQDDFTAERRVASHYSKR